MTTVTLLSSIQQTIIYTRHVLLICMPLKSLQMVIAAMKLKDAYSLDTTLRAESEEELKSLLVKVKVESEKVGFKLNIKKTKIMASGPITSWEIDGETV